VAQVLEKARGDVVLIIAALRLWRWKWRRKWATEVAMEVVMEVVMCKWENPRDNRRASQNPTSSPQPH